MKETITIKNFGGLKDVTIPLNSINVFIGKQASGKSITAKLLYFFKGLLDDIRNGVIENKGKSEIDLKIREKFENYFPPNSWSSDKFYLMYKIDNESIEIENSKKLKINYSEKLKKHFTTCRRLIRNDRKAVETQESFNVYRPSFELNKKYYSYITKEFGDVAKNNQVFIPAGRSFFASLQSTIFSLLSNNKSVDPFIIEFGSFYERYSPSIIQDFNRDTPKSRSTAHDLREIEKLIYEIIGAKIIRQNGKIYLLHSDRRKVELPFSSSGQQETLPLSLMLAFFSKASYVSGGTTIYIEEPEAHLFPSAQKKIVELIATVHNKSRSSLQFVITTHSPYILTSINNLLNAGSLKEQGVDEKKLYKIVPKSEIIKPNEVNAFAMKDGKVINLIDEETGLISADLLDQVSEEIAVQFDELLDL